MFQFPALASCNAGWYFFKVPGCPIRKSADQRSFAPTRSLSQLITSFIASESQGIRHAPLLTFSLTDNVWSIYTFSFNFTFLRYIMSKIVLSGINNGMSAFNFTFFWSHHVKERCFNYKTIIKTEWRITDSNRWPPACKAGALASWANPPSYKWKTESGKWKIRRVPDFQFSIFSFQLWSSPRQSWTADLYIISVAL